MKSWHFNGGDLIGFASPWPPRKRWPEVFAPRTDIM